MEAVSALLELFPTRAPYILIMFGLLTALSAVIPFNIKKRGWIISNPKDRWSRIIVLLLGGLITGAGIVTMYLVDDPEFNRLRNKHVVSYHSILSLSGSEQDCASSRCRLSYHDSVILQAPAGEEATYRGRIKTSGRIISINSTPRAEILNPESFPGNPTYLEFQISPASPDQRILEAQGEAVLEKTLSPTDGKVGWHLPYDTSYAVVVLDLRALGFAIQNQIQARIETRRADGTLVSGYYSPRINIFQDGRVIVLTARDVAADSSITVSW